MGKTVAIDRFYRYVATKGSEEQLMGMRESLGPDVDGCSPVLVTGSIAGAWRIWRRIQIAIPAPPATMARAGRT